jgi:hypothetical protein
MSYIDESGKYHKGKVDPSKLRRNQQSGWKDWDHQRQRKDYAREIVQPFDRQGKPNEQFKQAWPDESKEYYGKD